ncbi:N-acetyltransferase GCN5 [Sporocytophaga myxococcoides]|uniref:N-acetyltransferase GCN5 n=1 Tax=Sporocytophaga myxococcoides TaxID=153721 RepID=A0A098LCE7_9BACT|nr:N-acetyltransferase [Sporocytophaga myxococcoides]GAL84666.1 N-acetyltransferase GCN5 [Sporocytophaga myxococcoides]
MNIRQEVKDDYSVTENLIQEAFLNAEFSNQKEHILVHKLRYTEAFVPQLSLIAESDNQIVGHILFTKVKIEGNITKESLALAPLSVLPKVQNHGIGSRLMKYGLEKAKELDFESVIVLGHPKYYKKFGFVDASRWNIKCPFDVPNEVFMALQLKENALNDAAGMVQYPGVFTE